MSDIVTYDPEDRIVYFTGKDEPKEIHRDVSSAEFKEIEKMALVNRHTALDFTVSRLA
ncbi:hypothetical protein [Natronosalvus amylolyticus]|uniref:hypothetical protein n=1 Tax=Natronosalvus amylolyticus TaxID=2961994 RepID=UPI0020C9B197|nr:hypothetical protein [Natronosalvus amylolyticus]